MPTIYEALELAQRTLLGKPGIYGISVKDNRIVVYAEHGTFVPSEILGFPVEVVYTSKIRKL